VFDWNDLRIALAVAREGSTLAAGKALRISQSTAARRIAALEEALGVELFDRRQEGYRLTPAGQSLLPALERVESEVNAFSEQVGSLNRSVEGTVRVATLDIAASLWIHPALPALRALHPKVNVEVLTGDEKVDLARGEADVALRFGPRPTEPGLVFRSLGHVESALYCSRSYAAAHGMPEDVAELDRHAIIRGTGYVDTRPHHVWLAAHAKGARIVYRGNSTIGILEAVRSGLGIGALPTIVARGEPELLRVRLGPTEFGSDAWLVTTESSRRLPHVRAFMDFIAERVAHALT
jgi:DNA-binding transcriptional LysR family regulator